MCEEGPHTSTFPQPSQKPTKEEQNTVPLLAYTIIFWCDGRLQQIIETKEEERPRLCYVRAHAMLNLYNSLIRKQMS